MRLLLPILLFLLAILVFSAVKLRLISNQTLQILANVSSVAATITAIAIIPWSITPSISPNITPSLEHPARSHTLQISSPKNGEEVGEFVTVEGNTGFSDLNHYIVVGPETGDVWVTDGPLLVNDGNHWVGRARLGTGEIGKGEIFLIHAIATNTKFSIGKTTMEQIDNSSSAIATVKVRRIN